MGIVKTIKSRFTMKFVDLNFTDRIGGVRVNDYKDCYGTKWMATSGSPIAWRVKKAVQKNV